MCSLIIVAILAISILIYLLHKRYRKDFIEDFHTKNVFITGTDSGFGRKLALDLDQKGLKVYASCYSEKGAEDLKQIASSRMKIFRIDVTKRESILKAKELIENDLPASSGLWALVNNAGISKAEIFEFATIQDYRDVLDVNFFGPVEVSEIFLPLVKKARGRIINVASIAGICNLHAGAYSASKFALEAYNDGLRRSLKPFGVKVSVIEPGLFSTNITDVNCIMKSLDQQWDKLQPQLKEEYGEQYFIEVKKRFKHSLDSRFLARWNKVEMVTLSMMHAIGSKHPKDRYTIGLDANLFYKPLCFLPDIFMDTVFDLLTRKCNKLISKK